MGSGLGRFLPNFPNFPSPLKNILIVFLCSLSLHFSTEFILTGGDFAPVDTWQCADLLGVTTGRSGHPGGWRPERAGQHPLMRKEPPSLPPAQRMISPCPLW